ncbi:MAG TPA: KpsF/GutQ family sugar-phosphate isomerase [Candidatus Avirikenella pullistercoris]|nr:KpsF/GutQ family sugar-phosphate isomerase [Candidatus Avirikenella pullistercoris]
MVNHEQIKSFAKSIIETETQAIKNLAGYIDDNFATIAELIIKSKGRVIVTGIGKSAIIGNKIVATLNSTGTPAIFMHAADAIHGDLGMIQNHDTVICISKSGNTPEIKVLIPLIRNIYKENIIIGMVGNTDSFLAQISDYVINTYVTKEACPNNLAPTSSTTAQLVMGDALAMTLLKLRGFTAADFAKVHPGGALGKRLYIRVQDLISHNAIPSVKESADIDEVIIEISSKMLGATAVTDAQGKLIGIITDGDLRRMLQKKVDLNSVRAKDIMSSNPKTISKEELAVKAFATMEEKKITQLIVTDENNKYCGIIHIHDILREGVV